MTHNDLPNIVCYHRSAFKRQKFSVSFLSFDISRGDNIGSHGAVTLSLRGDSSKCTLEESSSYTQSSPSLRTARLFTARLGTSGEGSLLAYAMSQSQGTSVALMLKLMLLRQQRSHYLLHIHSHK